MWECERLDQVSSACSRKHTTATAVQTIHLKWVYVWHKMCIYPLTHTTSRVSMGNTNYCHSHKYCSWNYISCVPTSQAPQSYTKRPHSKLLCDKWVDIVMLTHNTKGADNLGCIYSLDLRAESVSIGLLPVIRYSYIHSQKWYWLNVGMCEFIAK